ncbi:hypothetical protein NDU88_002136 [Pleurodeles waltl]|uniref:Uncharacterized protein n=1 Tax=Pleurodeles waltl TaxID=8319 RepID=A0AAV7LZN7_PLEWA|nr:hypothetical protein NDU88_002136 [Pleurodeles waltl]
MPVTPDNKEEDDPEDAEVNLENEEDEENRLATDHELQQQEEECPFPTGVKFLSRAGSSAYSHNLSPMEVEYKREKREFWLQLIKFEEGVAK